MIAHDCTIDIEAGIAPLYPDHMIDRLNGRSIVPTVSSYLSM